MQPITARDARRLVQERSCRPYLGDIRARIAHEAYNGRTEMVLSVSYFQGDADLIARILRILEQCGFSLSLSSETLTISWR